MSHRISFWKTIALAATMTLVCAALIFPAQMLPGLLAPIAVALLFTAATAAAAIALAGLLCVYRDSRQQAGKPDLFYRWMQPSAALDRARLLYRPLLGRQPRAGDLVRVRSETEILRTLDASGALDSLPFMPEMRRYCGKTFRVDRRVDQINDMITKTGLRRFHRAVTLRGLRCDGTAHGGCQAECQILWKDAWLERIGSAAARSDVQAEAGASERLAALLAAHKTQMGSAEKTDTTPRYRCQITELLKASHCMSTWDIRRDLRALWFGNVGWRAFAVALLTRLFNRVQWWRGGNRHPWRPQGSAIETPRVDIALQPGDCVRIKDGVAIALTLDRDNRNRGMWFDPEMLRFCGQEYTVHRRIERLIDERSGKMLTVKTPSITLAGVTATGEFLRFCPQNEYIFWREIWLEPISRNTTSR